VILLAKDELWLLIFGSIALLVASGMFFCLIY
jgi:hypothetical protein